MKHGVCVQVIGDLNLLPRDVQEVVAEAMFISRNNTRWELKKIITFIKVTLLKVKTSSGHVIALWKKHCGIDQKRLII